MAIKVHGVVVHTKKYTSSFFFLKGTIIELDNKTADPIKLLANGKEVARGEVVIIEDNFGIRITNISKDDTSEE